jgi:hypothetical protein
MPLCKCVLLLPFNYESYYVVKEAIKLSLIARQALNSMDLISVDLDVVSWIKRLGWIVVKFSSDGCSPTYTIGRSQSSFK